MRRELEPWLIAALIVLLLSITGCSLVKGPTLLDTDMTELQCTPNLISDCRILSWSAGLVKWWGDKSLGAEWWGTALGITFDAVSIGAVAASRGANANVLTGLASGAAFIASLYRRTDPAAKDNAFGVGSKAIGKAIGTYLKCITKGGATVAPKDTVSLCAGNLLAVNYSAVATVGALMQGLLPSKEDFNTVVGQ